MMNAADSMSSPQSEYTLSAELLLLFSLLAVSVGVTLQVLWNNFTEGKLSFTRVLSLIRPQPEPSSKTKEVHDKESSSIPRQRGEVDPGLSIIVNRSRLVQSSKGTFAQFKITSRCGEDEFMVWR